MTDKEKEKEKDFADYKTQRATTKGSISRIKTYIDQKANTLTATELECRLGILESYFKQVLVYQGCIERIDASEASARGELEDLYCTTKSKILNLMGCRKSSSPDNSMSFLSSPVTLTSNLPKLEIPLFSGKYSEYSNFISTFTKLIHNNENLSNIEKFNHLLNCVTGPALQTIKVFNVSDDDYPKALERLKKRYDNKNLIFLEHINALFSLSKVLKGSATQLRSPIHKVTANFSSLQSLGTYENIANALIIHIVSSRLDSESLSKWEESVDYEKLSSWSDCSDILTKRCKYLEAREDKAFGEESHTASSNRVRIKTKSIQGSRSTTAMSVTVTQQTCSFCKETDHQIYKCKQFTDLPVDERFNAIKNLALCVNCLGKGHSVRKCTSRRCRICQRPHHSHLHRFTVSSMSSASSTSNTTPTSSSDVENLPSSSNDAPNVRVSLKTFVPRACKDHPNKGHVFLATAIVKVKDRSGCYHPARAILDSASQINLITENMCQKLRLKRDKLQTQINGISDVSTNMQYTTQITIQSRFNNYEIDLQAGVLSSITGLQPECNINVVDWNIPSNVELADPLFHKAQNVDLLIGAEKFFSLLSIGQIQLGDGYPTLQKTLLGWIVSGRYKISPPKEMLTRCNITTDSVDSECSESLEKLVERFWQVEDLNSTKPHLTPEQNDCEEFFLKNICQMDDGKFMVRLPFKGSPEKLGSSFEIAQKRFLSLERRLSKDPLLKEQYVNFLREYLLSGHMEVALKAEIPKVHYYIPHQCVLKPDSSTTKLRVVFDASCRTSSNLSLNELLMVGPTVQEDLFIIILKFRCHKYALTGDIHAMYRQIWMHPEDRHFQYILWREHPHQELQTFRLNTVTYGTAAAPYLATRCLKLLAEQYSTQFPEASKIIAHDFYVDDLITGADTREEVNLVRDQVDSILRSAGMKLRKWYSNDKNILDAIPEADREKPLRINDSDIIKTLGIVWEPSSDEFRFTYQLHKDNNHRITKRSVLSDVSRLFDPLGLISPVIIKAKIFLQELWLMKLNWDESLPMNLEYVWRTFRDKLIHLNSIRLPRLVVSVFKINRLEIHGFSDASERAYGCCVYVRTVDNLGQVSVHLLSAKSRVAPLKTKKSLLCLELCAAEHLSSLLTKIQNNFPKPIDAIYAWTDSKIVLAWP